MKIELLPTNPQFYITWKFFTVIRLSWQPYDMEAFNCTKLNWQIPLTITVPDIFQLWITFLEMLYIKKFVEICSLETKLP